MQISSRLPVLSTGRIFRQGRVAKAKCVQQATTIVIQTIKVFIYQIRRIQVTGRGTRKTGILMATTLMGRTTQTKRVQ